MKEATLGLPVFESSVAMPIAPLFSRNWQELWHILLGPEIANSSEVLKVHANSEQVIH
jgi:hypothetical protein